MHLNNSTLEASCERNGIATETRNCIRDKPSKNKIPFLPGKTPFKQTTSLRPKLSVTLERCFESRSAVFPSGYTLLKTRLISSVYNKKTLYDLG